MLFRQLPIEVKLHVLRCLDCADIFSLSLASKSLRALINRHRNTLPGRAIEICYEQLVASEVDASAFEGDSLRQLLEAAAKVGSGSVLGALEIVDIGTWRSKFCVFPVADSDERRPLIANAYGLPDEVKELLRSVLVHDTQLAEVSRLLFFTDLDNVPLMAGLLDFLTEHINVPIGTLLLSRTTTNDNEELNIPRIVGIRETKQVAHFIYCYPCEVSDALELCTSFGSDATFRVSEWDCEEVDSNNDIGPSYLMSNLLTARYHDECRMLVEIEQSVRAGDAIMPDQLLARIRTVFRFLYSTINNENHEPIRIPPHGVWLNFTEVAIRSMPADFWSEVFDGLAPVEAAQPLFIPHSAEEVSEERYVCDVYELRTPHREKAMRVSVARHNPESVQGLLIHFKWE